MHLCLRTQHGGGRYRTPTSRFGVRDSTPRPPRPLEYMLTCGTKGHYILPLSDLSKTVIVMTRIPRMIHGIVQVLVSLWFYYLTRPSRKRIRVTKTPLTPHLYMSLVLRKPVFGVFDQVPLKRGCTATKDG